VPPPLPQPNGYADLLQAGERITDEPADSRTASADELRSYLAKNQESLTLARTGLSRGVGVPLARTLQQQVEKSSDSIGKLRRLARLLDADARLALAESRPDAALRDDLDLVRMGCAMGRGGLILDSLSGCAVIRMGLNGLAEMRSGLIAEERAHLIKELETISAARESVDQVLSRDQAYSLAASDRRIQFYYVFLPSLRKLRQPADRAYELAHKRSVARMNLLRIDLALREYRREHRSAPETLTPLVPRFLNTIPNDPFTGRAPVYRKLADGQWKLYSIGPDGRDDDESPLTSSGATYLGDITVEDPPSP
jgi:hypothetical protein